MSSCYCRDCDIDTIQAGEYYSVLDEVWAEAGMRYNGGMLCISCLEQRIGRSLQPTDFKDCPLNRGWLRDKSQKLLDRLGLAASITKK